MPIQTPSYAVPREDLGEAILEYDPSVDGFIGTKVLPVRPVRLKAATVSVLTRENLKAAITRHANGAAFSRVNLNVEDLAYACVDNGLEGQLTASIHGETTAFTRELVAVLETKAGRLVRDGFPTGVEVCASMVHGGPYPATSDGRSSAVGPLAMERFTRRVCWQGEGWGT